MVQNVRALGKGVRMIGVCVYVLTQDGQIWTQIRHISQRTQQQQQQQHHQYALKFLRMRLGSELQRRRRLVCVAL